MHIEIYCLVPLFFVGQWARVVNNCTHHLEGKVSLRRIVDFVVGMLMSKKESNSTVFVLHTFMWPQVFYREFAESLNAVSSFQC